MNEEHKTKTSNKFPFTLQNQHRYGILVRCLSRKPSVPRMDIKRHNEEILQSSPSSPSSTSSQKKLEKGCIRPRFSFRKHSDERTTKNRKLINNYLHRLGNCIDTELYLNKEGVCYYQYKKFTIGVEVPKDNSGFFFLFSLVSQLGEKDNKVAVMQEAMRLNYMQQGTRGACLGLKDDEVNLCFSAPISGLKGHDDFVTCIKDFMETSVEVNQKLECMKR